MFLHTKVLYNLDSIFLHHEQLNEEGAWTYHYGLYDESNCFINNNPTIYY